MSSTINNLRYQTEPDGTIWGQDSNGKWYGPYSIEDAMQAIWRAKRYMNTPAHIITHEGREYDLYTLETPFGILEEKAPKVAKALEAWPHGWEIYHDCGWVEAVENPEFNIDHAYRAKPAPKSPWFIPQDGVAYDRVEVKTIGGVLHIREVKP